MSGSPHPSSRGHVAGLLVWTVGLALVLAIAVWAFSQPRSEDAPAGPSGRVGGEPVATPGPTASSDGGEDAGEGEDAGGTAATEGRPEELVPLARAAERNTVFLATRESPWPPRRNAVWCATLEMAWRELGGCLGGPPLRVQEEAPAAAALSAARPVPVPTGSAWAQAGRCIPAAIGEAERSLLMAFPKAATLWQPIPAGPGYFSVAYLEAAFQFTHPFRVIEAGHAFYGREDESACVTSFGIPAGAVGRLRALRHQVAVLYDPVRFAAEDTDEPGRSRRLTYAEAEAAPFVLDLDRRSEPFQILLARVERKETLAATWAHVADLVAHAAHVRADRPGLGSSDVLRVPCMHWDLEHEYRELVGLRVANPGFESQRIEKVYQRTRLRLDEKGVDLSSLAAITTRGGAGRVYAFQQPYLLALRQRGAIEPFFLCYVEDTKLLKPFE